jgi:hypothetical protein
MVHQKEQWHALQDNIKHEAAQRQGELTDERAAVVARLADLNQREATLDAGQTTTIEHAERQLPTFARASQNVPMAATLLDTLLASSTDRVGEVYQRLKIILGTVTTQQVESSLQHRVDAYVSSPIRPKDGGQRAT